jgi:amino acid permease
MLDYMTALTANSSLPLDKCTHTDTLCAALDVLTSYTGTIGTGLFLGIGNAFANAGPLSVLLGYTFTGVAMFAMMQCLGEMSTWLPLPGAIPQYCARYADPALGFAVGWNNCKKLRNNLLSLLTPCRVHVFYHPLR